MNPLATAADALSNCNGASVDTFANVAASWANASVGSVTFTNVGWNTSNVTNGHALADEGLDYNYSFIANASELLTLNYAISGGGSLAGFGLNGFNASLAGVNGSSSFLNLNTSGSLSWNLVAGDSYTLDLFNQANISGGLGTIQELMGGQFDFSTATQVPEPSSLPILAIGLVAFGGIVGKRASQRKQGGPQTT